MRHPITIPNIAADEQPTGPSGYQRPSQVATPYDGRSMSEDLASRKLSTLRRCLEETQRRGRQMLFGLTTALELHMVPLPERCSLDVTMLHSVASARGKRMASKNVIPHIWPLFDASSQIRLLADVYVLDLVHTWAQMARFVPLEQFVVLTESIAMRMSLDGYANPLQRMRNLTETAPSFRGRLLCSMALRIARPNVMSPQETKCRLVLICHGVPCPVTNHTVSGMTFLSGAPMTVDMAWPEAKVAVEYDGDHHRTDKRQWRRDQEKREHLQAKGWIVYVVNADVLQDDETRAYFAFRVARMLISRDVPVDFTIRARPLRDLCR
ncbi:hypothetical protein DF200_01835 [Bifidobacterium catulorum]|uniref:DUF559 domain-containing protein n=2 Tax=Bifidobacterium catulorum TaxID=1630173 RepID=A0A2U2MUX2_9BIFI|nr:hypothetical protein DF200_01835 [Bifidobacterium catulorum]